MGRQPATGDGSQVVGAGGDAHQLPAGVDQLGHAEAGPVVRVGLLVQHRVGEGLFEEGGERGLGDAEVEQPQVVAGPRRRVGGHSEAGGDAGGHAGAEVAQHAVEIEADQHGHEDIERV